MVQRSPHAAGRRVPRLADLRRRPGLHPLHHAPLLRRQAGLEAGRPRRASGSGQGRAAGHRQGGGPGPGCAAKSCSSRATPSRWTSSPALQQPRPVPGNAKPGDVEFARARGRARSIPAPAPTPSRLTSRRPPGVRHRQDGEKTGTARARLIPNLDWSFNFDNGEVPTTWLGCAYRHIVIDWDLYQKPTKADPQAGQMYIYISEPVRQCRSLAPLMTTATSGCPGRTCCGSCGSTARASVPGRRRRSQAVRRLAQVPPCGREGHRQVRVVELSGPQDGERRRDRRRTAAWAAAKGAAGRRQRRPVQDHDDPQGDVEPGLVRPGHLPRLHDPGGRDGSGKGRQVADIGLIAQRYADLMGPASSSRSGPGPRSSAASRPTLPLKWEPNVWYTMSSRPPQRTGRRPSRPRSGRRGKRSRPVGC